MELGVSQLLLIKMIVGHGIDIEALASIQNAVEKREGFAQRVLTDKEMERFASLKGRRQIEYFRFQEKFGCLSAIQISL